MQLPNCSNSDQRIAGGIRKRTGAAGNQRASLAVFPMAWEKQVDQP